MNINSYLYVAAALAVTVAFSVNEIERDKKGIFLARIKRCIVVQKQSGTSGYTYDMYDYDYPEFPYEVDSGGNPLPAWLLRNQNKKSFRRKPNRRRRKSYGKNYNADVNRRPLPTY